MIFVFKRGKENLGLLKEQFVRWGKPSNSPSKQQWASYHQKMQKTFFSYVKKKIVFLDLRLDIWQSNPVPNEEESHSEVSLISDD